MKIKPTEGELEILQVLWQDGPSSVREVNEKLNTNKNVGYTTTLKLLQIMNEKGLTDRDTSSRTHIYRAAIKESDTKNGLLSKFIEATFQGSAAQLVMEALGNNNTTQKELEDIKALIEKIENENS
ncbi:MAG: BlaI/MecI/CopY family transcriptional regulator [Saprospiraceae bacterium]|nr:BlaI/MecI/CopY family transcriptional regulator [Saprospiraceae bacterium]